MISRVAPRVSRHDDVIARMQRFARNTLTIQLAAGAPLDRPALSLAVLVRGFHVNKRVRVAEQELYQVSFNRDRLVLEVGGRKRMVGLQAGASHQGHSGDEQN